MLSSWGFTALVCWINIQSLAVQNKAELSQERETNKQLEQKGKRFLERKTKRTIKYGKWERKTGREGGGTGSASRDRWRCQMNKSHWKIWTLWTTVEIVDRVQQQWGRVKWKQIFCVCVWVSAHLWHTKHSSVAMEAALQTRIKLCLRWRWHNNNNINNNNNNNNSNINSSLCNITRTRYKNDHTSWQLTTCATSCRGNKNGVRECLFTVHVLFVVMREAPNSC